MTNKLGIIVIGNLGASFGFSLWVYIWVLSLQVMSIGTVPGKSI